MYDMADEGWEYELIIMQVIVLSLRQLAYELQHHRFHMEHGLS
jgi:hypothetical protein